MGWLFESPPAIWQWIGIIVGILAFVGFVVSAPTIFQIFYGKPKIKVSFEKKLGYQLICWIKSVPPSRFLAWIGVDRRILDIECLVSILDMSGNLVEFFPYPTASSKNLRIPVVGINNRERGQVFLIDQTNKHGKMLDRGLYVLEMEIWDAKDNVQIQKIKKYFRVNPQNPFVEWIDKVQNAKTKSS